jgi:hypothetical protein
MKNHFLILLLTLQTLVACAQTQTTKSSDFFIANVSVISMKTNEVLNNQDVMVKDGKIVSITKHSKNKDKKMLVVDGSNKFIMPSLSDAHVHLPATEEELENVLKLNLINGVTKLRSMRGDWKHFDWRVKQNTKESYYPKLYLSAPPISRNVDWTVTEIENYVKASKDRNFELIKILSIKGQPLFKQLDSICKKYNMPIGGHYPRLASGNELNEEVVFNSGYTSFEHLGGLAGESQETISRRIALLKEKKMVICPTLSWYSVGSGRYTIEESINMPGMEFVPKAKMDEWVDGTNKYREKLGQTAYKDEVVNELKALDEKYKIIKQLYDAGVPMILSPDATSKYMVAGFNVLGEMELLKNANLPNFEILKMATVNYANFFNENYGTIEVGKDADFILLNANPLEDLKTLKNVQGVYYNQNFLDKKALDVMRESVLKAVKK